VKRRPDLFAAFVGIGQVVSWREMVETQYRYTLTRARAESNPVAVKELEALGIPALDNFDQYIVMRRQLNRYLAASDLQWLSQQDSLIRAQLSADDFRAYQKGFQTMTGLASTVFSMDASALGFNFKLPVFLVQGTEDHITDSSSAAQYFKDIQAPLNI
jgi:pimeloyl-ACP methyl ester carboxylesterase